VDGWIGVATSANCSAKLYIDDILVQDSPFSSTSTIQSNIPGLKFTQINSPAAPTGGSPFMFRKGAVHKIRLEFQAFSMEQDLDNIQNINSKVELFWNLVDRHNSIEKVRTLLFPSIILTHTTGHAHRLGRRHCPPRRSATGTRMAKAATAPLSPSPPTKPP